MSQATGSGFVRQRIEDANAAWSYLHSLWNMLMLSRRQRGIEMELTLTHGQIGDAAEKAHLGDELEAMHGVRETRAALIAAQAEMEQRKGALAAAEQERRQQQARHDQIIAPVETACHQLRQEASAAASAEKAARQEVGRIERGIQRVEGALAKPASAPLPPLQKQLADLRQALGPARQNGVAATEKCRQATRVADDKQAELDRAREARRLAMAVCDEEIARSHSAIKAAEATVGECEGSLAAAHGALGKAVLDANLSGAGIDESVARARSLMQQIAVVGQQSSQNQVQAGANRGGAIRSAATLAVVVLAVSLMWMLIARLVRPAHPTVAGSPASQPAAVASGKPASIPQINAPPGAPPAVPTLSASPDVSAALAKAVLALPRLTSPTCKITGTLAVTRATARAGSARILDMTVPVEIRASAQARPLSGNATLRVLADAQDRILNSEVTLPDPDLAELEALGNRQPGNR